MRYTLTSDDLRRLSKLIVMGRGLAERVQQVDGTSALEDAENWADAQVSVYLGVPLKPTPAPGQSALPDPLTRLNYPIEFIQAILYYALSRLLASEFSENQPNVSELVNWCEAEAYRHLQDFRSRSTVAVGAGRRRHPNPFMPPNVAPPEQPPQQGFTGN